MKSLKKLAAVAALLSAMNFAKATEQKEVDYRPDTLNGVENFENSDLKLVNGQLMVESTGKSDDSKAYMFVGTNTQNFASSAFAKGGMDDLTAMVNVGSDLYMMEKGNSTNVFHTVVSDKPELNGMTNPVDTLSTNDVRAAAIMNAKKGNSPIVFDDEGNVWTVNDDRVLKNGENANDWIAEMAGKRKDDLVVVNGRGYVLAEGTLYSGKKPVVLTGVKSVASMGDNKHIAVTTEDAVKVYDTETRTFDASKETSIESPSGQKVKASVMGKDGKTIYYITKTKVGYVK